MKKIIGILLVLVSFSLFAKGAAPVGDSSGNDLNPVVRGFNIGMAGGIAAWVGKAGEHSSTIASMFQLKIGYDFVIKDVVRIGPVINLGIMQLDTDSHNLTNHIDSPWVGDYAPLIPGLDIYITWLATKRFEFGGNVGFDAYLNNKALDSSGKETEVLLGINVGLMVEYHTYMRNFSFGLTSEFSYLINFDGMNISVLPFIKVAF